MYLGERELAGELFARELFPRGTISPGNFFEKLFLGNSFQRTLSREIFRATFSQGTFSKRTIVGYDFNTVN
jgi:hypothetical protein